MMDRSGHSSYGRYPPLGSSISMAEDLTSVVLGFEISFPCLQHVLPGKLEVGSKFWHILR